MSAVSALARRHACVVDEPSVLVAELMASRQTTRPKRLLAPGPDDCELQAIWAAAATAPDHGQLLPWRFVLVPLAARSRLAEVFAQALLARDDQAHALQLAQAREKAYRAPLLMLAVVNASCGDPEVDFAERILSAGCAVQNMLLMANAQGYGSALTSGKALKSVALRQLFDLSADEHALCFVSIGTAASHPRARTRPGPDQFSSALSPAPTTRMNHEDCSL
jgi:nitroreductase